MTTEINEKFVFFLRLLPNKWKDIPAIKKFFDSYNEALEYGMKVVDKHFDGYKKEYEEFIDIFIIEKEKAPRFQEMFKESTEEQAKERIAKLESSLGNSKFITRESDD